MFIIRVNLNSIGPINAYIADIDDSTCAQVFDPSRAIAFKSKKNANEYLKNNITSIESICEIVDRKPEIETFNAWVSGGYMRWTMAKPLIDKNIKYDKSKHSALDVLNQRIYMSLNDGMVSYNNYKTWPELFEIFKHLWSVECYYSKDSDDELDLTFQIMVKRDSNFIEFKKELDLVLDKITRINFDGYKILSIIDRNLGEGGDFAYLHIKSEDDCYVDGRFTRSIGSTCSLEEAFDYIRKNRYYA